MPLTKFKLIIYFEDLLQSGVKSTIGTGFVCSPVFCKFVSRVVKLTLQSSHLVQ